MGSFSCKFNRLTLDGSNMGAFAQSYKPFIFFVLCTASYEKSRLTLFLSISSFPPLIGTISTSIQPILRESPAFHIINTTSLFTILSLRNLGGTLLIHANNSSLQMDRCDLEFYMKSKPVILSTGIISLSDIRISSWLDHLQVIKKRIIRQRSENIILHGTFYRICMTFQIIGRKGDSYLIACAIDFFPHESKRMLREI